MPAETTGDLASFQKEFVVRFNRAPEGVWTAPGRVNLVGEHTDYNDGFVLPLALDRRVTVAAARRDDGLLRLASRERGERAVHVADVRPGAVDGWVAYVTGPVWALAQAGVQVGGLDLLLTSDVPVGSGLSSSAAVECAVVLATAELYDGPGDRVRLALIAQRAENEVVGVPSGIMDQMASLTCTAGHALFLDTRSLQTDQVPFAPATANMSLLVMDTRAPHALADGAYAERRRSCEEAAQILGVRALRDASPEQVEALADRLGPVRLRRARHVVSENARVREVVHLLRRGRLDLIGPQLTASHCSLRDDYEVSTAELDVAVDAALSAGAHGARMTGAGFGGCALALVPTGAVDAVTDTVHRRFAAADFSTPDVFSVDPSYGARRVA